MIKFLLSLFKLSSHEQVIIRHASAILAVLEVNWERDNDGQLALLDTAIALLQNKRNALAAKKVSNPPTTQA